MIGHIRAEWVRLGKRRALQVIVIAVPLLAAFFFLSGYASIWEGPPPFDAAEVRARIIAEGYYLEGVPPEEVEAVLAQAIESERVNTEMQLADLERTRSGYAFPESLVTVFGSSMVILFALILLTATTIGDEFSWGTIRTTLIASSHRRRLLLVRLAAMALIAVLLLVSLLFLGLILPFVLSAAGARLPTPGPIDAGALGVLILGQLVAGLAVIAFAAMATLLVRSGSLTLVVLLVYVLIEAAILAVLLQFEGFRDNGPSAWILDAFPVRGMGTMAQAATRAASGLPGYPGEVVVRNLGAAALPLLSLSIWTCLFAGIALRRFRRMDIAE